MKRQSITPSVLFGIGALAIGILLLLRNFNLIPGFSIQFWPTILVIFGLSQFTQSPHFAGKAWGVLLTLMGGYLMLDTAVSFRKIWPVFLILAGVTLIWRSLQRQDKGPSPAANLSVLSGVTVFAGNSSRIDSQEFRGGDVVTVFGGHEIDLKDASPAGGEAIIDANVIFGGVEVKVPTDWTVILQGVPIFGGYEDNTVAPKAEDGAPRKRLIVRGFAIFGGVEVKN